MSCCFPKKLLNRRTKREDVYKVREEEIPEVKVAPPEPQFSWDKRENVDLSQFVVSDIHGEVHKRTGNNKDAMQIENCTESSIFLLKPTASLTIDDCRDCLIILGPCSGSVFIRDCSNCIILSACQQLRTRDCHDIQLGLLCPTQPIIENSNDIHFHPLALNYDDFKSQMRDVALSMRTNRVKSVHDFTPEGGKRNYKIHDSFIKMKQEYLDAMDQNLVTVDEKASVLPVFNSNLLENNPSRYIYSLQDNDEPNEDFCERGLTFSSLLKSSSLKLVSSIDIDTKKVDRTMLSIPGDYERFMVFEVIGDQDEMEKLCRENFDLFVVLDEGSATEMMTKLINAYNSKE